LNLDVHNFVGDMHGEYLTANSVNFANLCVAPVDGLPLCSDIGI